MFGLFNRKKKEKEYVFYSMADGTSIDITEVEDETFTSKLLGEGIAVKPSSDLFVAPCDGKITMIADTKHAIALEDKNGVQVLIHVGLDTVALKGEGFEVYCKEGQTVEVGTPLVKVDRCFLQEKGIKDTTMMVFVEMNGHIISEYRTGEAVNGGKSILVRYK